MAHHVLQGSSLATRVVLIVSLLSASAVAQTTTFRKIVDLDTPIPGGTGTFIGFSSTPVIDRGRVAFEGAGAGPHFGIYTDIGGTLRPVANTNTTGPGGIGKFVSAFQPSIDNARVAFQGTVRLDNGSFVSQGVYLETSGTITVVAERGMPAPGGGVFSFFFSNALSRPSISANRVAFSAYTSDAGSGVYISILGRTLSRVADGNTIVPEGDTTFQIVGRPYLSGNNIVFWGRSNVSTITGVYARIDGVLKVIADNTMMAPGGTTTFYGPSNPVIDGEDIAFTDLGSVSSSTDEQEGSYTYYDGVLDIGILGAPTAPGSPSLNNRALVANRGPGIITTNFGGSDFRLIGKGDVLDGKTLSIAYQSHEAISGNEIVFFALFDDGTQGIYVATIEGTCGNQVVENGEGCDDGNAVSGDGCSDTCQLEVVSVPTTSVWGSVILCLLLCVGARLRFGGPLVKAK